MRKISILAILIIIIGLAIFFWWSLGMSAVNTRDKSEKMFVIARGSAIRVVGNELKKEGLIRDPVVFFLYIRLNSLDRNIQAGSYRLSPSMDLSKIIDTLGHGKVDIWVTIPEGLRAEEIAQVLKENIPTYQDLWKSALINEEGYLFPDTYLIPRDADVATVISIFRSNFNTKIEQIGLSQGDPRLKKVVIIASMIEREAITDEEKPMISSVIANRLNDDMALDIDATLQYAKGQDQRGKWWSVPTVEDRKVQSLYNTYLNPGLPAGPISNPGIESIKAALNPASSDYYYYIHDTKGKVHFAKTLSEHNRNIQLYLN